ncbi:MAG TPA: aminopeptidase N [Nocardioidaceae bacterium]|nr:aminopeptidase N [Nocardioidaceae bacterium]
MRSLTREEARRRAEQLTVASYDVHLDLTGDDDTFGSTATVRFTSRGAQDTFVEVRPRKLRAVRLNGRELDPAELQEGRYPLRCDDGDNELVVDAVMGYRHDGEGLHRSTDPADGNPYTYAQTAMDAAPWIFGCFDQPDLKARFSLDVHTPTGWVAIGNGRAEQVEPGHWRMAQTKPLSTYLVTVVAGPYHVVTDRHDGIALGLSCRASLAPHLDKDAEELFTITTRCLDEYHRLFGIRYPFGDYHQAFVPEFNLGAMENPGCVTFRDPMVFSSRPTDSQRTQRATVMAHEMSHMWFGDLVTMRWWDDLWLNESFAEYMGYRVAHDVTAFTDSWVSKAFGRKYHGIAADQRPSTHPVAGNGAGTAAEALQYVDGITYVKGAAIVRQLNLALGDETFFAGLRAHFDRHRFGNAAMGDLIAAWEDAGAGDLGGWADAWLRTTGLDLLEVDRSGPVPVLTSQAPEAPTAREHTLTVVWPDQTSADGWTQKQLTVGISPAALPEAEGRPVLLDAADQTWARLGVDQLTLDALAGLLPGIGDPLLRGSVWNAVRDGLRNGRIDPDRALDLVAAALPHEDRDVAVGAIGALATDLLIDRLHPDPAAAAQRAHGAAAARLATAEPGSGLQLAAARLVVATAAEPTPLRDWLEGATLPEGLDLDVDLGWRILVRLATLGGVDRAELDRRFEDDPTSQARLGLVQALVALPDARAKEYGWSYFTGRTEASNYEIGAAGAGMWRRGQEDLTAPYVTRYFEEVAGTADLRSGWMLAEAAAHFYPRLALDPATLAAADRLLAHDGLDAGLRRTLTDQTDDLRRGWSALGGRVGPAR